MAPCKEEEYPVGSECCPKCSPGYRVKETCGELTGTLCVPCDPGTYTAHLNGLSECLQCRVCDPAPGAAAQVPQSPKGHTLCPAGTGPGQAGQGIHLARSSGRSTAGPRHTHQAAKLGWGAGHQPVPRPPAGAQRPAAAVQASAWSPPGTGRSALAIGARTAALSSFSWVPAMGLVTRQECSRRQNTVCVCDRDHFCVSENGGDCAECRPHTLCRPGQRVRAGGTEWHDRVCEDCPPGTFSASGTLEECQPWSTCSGPFETQADPGTSSSDVTCSSWGLYVFVSSLILVGLCVLTVLGVRMKNRRSPKGPSLRESHSGRSRSSGPSSPRHCDSVSVLQGDPPRRDCFTRSRRPHRMSPQWLWRRQRPCPPGGNDPLTDRWLQEASA
ncbi:tumor necrosis factor receptor superfamily member 14 isoform X2 [Callorhinus ursinus]|uniref:tumor necrosis factor receptor superfamily member 14 isoform X2 n=1 Tax=Callorhinus ursinus TaxID=34884 RepID=UPI003CD016C6